MTTNIPTIAQQTGLPESALYPWKRDILAASPPRTPPVRSSAELLAFNQPLMDDG